MEKARLKSISPLLEDFIKFAQNRLQYQQPPKIKFLYDKENANNPLGKTGYYDPQTMLVCVYTAGRHLKDIMRSLSHELVHHTQNCNRQFENLPSVGEGYAQQDSHLREMERDAYERGNLIFRDWEDFYKKGSM